MVESRSVVWTWHLERKVKQKEGTHFGRNTYCKDIVTCNSGVHVERIVTATNIFFRSSGNQSGIRSIYLPNVRIERRRCSIQLCISTKRYTSAFSAATCEAQLLSQSAIYNVCETGKPIVEINSTRFWTKPHRRREGRKFQVGGSGKRSFHRNIRYGSEGDGAFPEITGDCVSRLLIGQERYNWIMTTAMTVGRRGRGESRKRILHLVPR